ncbi:protein cramped isoform X2 [Sitodiplosis mosellana]|uniref:protein cramped isoform X2 n=1 Tax=Sitodiplosis mosellana TaxID=263140 RepID=UPI00244491AA|nr:protein cramped isoform X2 [Sitodiplosis mosellana]XP_055304647.1 protein cramped isoform X2 [Sitodiplosis mosellana]
MTPGKVTTTSDNNASSADLSLCAEVSHKDDAPTTDAKEIKKPIVSSDTDISNSIERNETKINDTAQRAKPPFDEKLKLETSEEQLLGSLTSMSSPAVRTSARVIQKMKMDSIRPTTPPPADKDEHHRNAQKTPNQHRPSKTIWNNIERNLFFDAINEYGKDFESIANYINGKQKRKNATDPTYKAKEHVRLLYYQTFTKISKYLRFSEDVAKKVQELYAIINYGEMRKKIPVDNQKFYMKLRELVYRGSVTWRVKGKNCRIKTPSCPALRKINQVEKWQEDIKLPAKVDVDLRPSDNESWYTVQSIAQNPRVKTSLPLQKRLISLLKTLQQKWKSREAKMWDQTMSGSSPKLNQTVTQMSSSTSVSSGAAPQTSTCSNALENSTNGESSHGNLQSNYSPYSEPVLCIAPPLDATIHRPYVNLTDFLNSYSICLNSYEERINASVRGESLCAEHITNVKETIKSNTKRQRHDSGSEKKSPDTKRTKATDGEKFEHEVMKKAMSSTSQDGMSTSEELVDEREFSSPTYENAMFEIEDANCHIPESSSADECETEINLWNGAKFKFEPPDDLNSAVDIKKEPPDQRNINKTTKKTENKSHLAMNKKRDLRTTNRESFRPLINEEVIQKIRKGWTIFNVGDITIGDLYIMFGQDSKVRLEYKWISPAQQNEIKTELTKMAQKPDATTFDGKEVSEDDIKSENVMIGTLSAPNNDDAVDTKPFHVGAKPKNSLSNKLKQLLMLASLMEKTKRKTSCACGHYCDRGVNKMKKDEVLPRSFISNKTYPASHNDSALFRQPVLPTRTSHAHFEPYRLNMNAPRNKQNRWVKGRNTRVQKQVVVQRILPLQPGITQPYGVYAAPDINYPIENSMIKPSSSASSSTSSVEYKSILTEENLSRMNHLSEDDNPNLRSSSIDKSSSNSSTQNNEDNSSASEHQKCDSGIESCDMIDSGDNEPEYSASDADQMDSDEEENNRIRQRLNEDPGIQSLMEISLPSPIPINHSVDEFYSDGIDSQPAISPMRILRESPVPTDSKWLDEHINDFSLSSFLGHLESNCDAANSRRSRSPRCLESSNMSTISETSVDYMTRFEEITEKMKNEPNNIVTP